jgi:GMP synthase PP-ATPase subunit
MQFRDFVKEFNQNVLINNYEIVDSGGIAGVMSRRAMLNRYTGVIQESGVLLGLKPVSYIKDDLFVLRFDLTVIDMHPTLEDKYVQKQDPTAKEEKIREDYRRLFEEVIQGNMDIDATLADCVFTPYFEVQS